MIRLNADVDDDKARRLHHLLVDEGITFAAWLRVQIDQYLVVKELKGKRQPRRGRKGWEKKSTKCTNSSVPI